MEDDYKPVIQPQRRLNPKVQDVVKNEIVKLLDSGLLYLISNSSLVSPIHVVPKKGGMTVVLNDNNELIPSRIVTGWRVCIDYRKLNDATRKDHFPLPFVDQMLERLCGNEYYCFLDGFLGFFQIPIAPEDQENTTFTCLYGTFAYRRMPFGLWAENLAAYHLSRLKNLDLGTFTKEEIIDEFPNEQLMILNAELNNDEPWYTDYVNYIVGKIMRCWETKILESCGNVILDQPRTSKVHQLLDMKVYESGFYWPSMFKDAKDYVMRYDACQRSGNISSRIFKKAIARFGVPIFDSDRGTHFCNSQLEKALQKYGVTHNLSTAYYPQTNGQTEVTNKAIKHILERSVRYNPKNWSEKLDDASWAFRTAYKTPTGCTPFRLFYGKDFHLPVESKHKAYWALKQCNMMSHLA
ncbi:reverse transcriptase domain-containing protein [Tanacetum coccineum]